jgi:CHAT domain-containing protein
MTTSRTFFILSLFFIGLNFISVRAQEVYSNEIDSIYWLQKDLYRKNNLEKVLEIGKDSYKNPPIRNTYTDSLLYAKIIAKVGDVYTNTFAESYKSFDWHQRALDALGTNLDESGTKFKAYVLYGMYYSSNIQSKFLQAEKYANKAIEVVNSYPETTGWILDLKVILACRLSDLNLVLGNIERSDFYIREAAKTFKEFRSFTDKKTSKPIENYFVSILTRRIQNITYQSSTKDKFSLQNMEKIKSYSKQLDTLYESHYGKETVINRWASENQMNIAGGYKEIAGYFSEEKHDLSKAEITYALEITQKSLDILEKIDLYNRNYVSTKIFYSRILSQLGRHQEGIKILNEIPNQVDEKSVRPHQLYMVKGEIWASAKNLDSSLYYFNKTAKSFQHETYQPLKKDLSNFTSNDRFPTEMQYLTRVGNILLKNFPDDLLAKENAYLYFNTAFKDFYAQFKNQRLNRSLESYLKSQIKNNLKLNPQFGDTLNINKMLSSIENIDNRIAWEKFNQSRNIFQLPILDSLEQIEFQLRKQLVTLKKEQNSNKVDSITKLLQEYKKNINQNYSNFSDFTQSSFEVEQFQKKISKDEIVLKYIFFEEEFVVFQISNSEIKWELQPWTSKEKDLLENHLKYLKNPSSDYKVNESLTLALLPKSVLNYKKISVIPDNEVYLLPFETLNYNGEYILKTHSLRYSSHLRFAYYEEETKDKSETKSTIFAPEYASESTQLVTRSKPVFLEGAQKEAKHLESLFPSQTFIGKTATKENFVKFKAKGKILHLAMHATSDVDNPGLSYFNFYNDEKLYLEELYALKIPADLAVLSACNTAIGKEDGSLSVSSLHRAFNYAGTKATIASLWEVPDESTSQIMISFYEHLKDGEKKSVALQKAKLDYLNTTKVEKFKHPYYWAGFVLYGDNKAVQMEGNQYESTFLIGICALIVILFLYYLKKQKKILPK